jgi:predicted RNA-binding protein with TRAM domain
MPYAARGFDRDLSKSVEVGKEYEVEIQEISRRGDGIARIEGLVVFIPNTKQGDKLRIKITNVSRRFAEAEVINKIIEETGETK